MPEEYSYTNRLINEKSPYLLQHSHNPVDWYPWNREAFTLAKELDRPIFLSIGYATCHWCHVMEQESFDNLQIAEMMNDTFVNIKVDREEMPDIDSLYMEFAQSMMSGAAGWPLNVVLTPELQPFFATTYLPPSARHGLMGLVELIARIRQMWNSEEREKVLMQAEKIVEVFSESQHVRGKDFPQKEQIEATAELLFKLADPVYGGMKGTPKFPIGYQSNFMLRDTCMTKDSRALFIVERTLDMMHRGGIYDHLGGGFSRYSVDEQWLVPHFEKMLYDNAILAETYLEAWQVTKNPLYRHVCEDILHYVLKEMTHHDGGFFSAEDSDSEGVEGLYYTWKYEEVENILGTEQAHLFCEYYGITPEGNFDGRNILHTPLTIEEFASKVGKDPAELHTLITEQKKLLLKMREGREHPFKDDKILTSWNGLMIHSLIRAGTVFSEPRYTTAGLKAASFLAESLWKKGKLYRRWRDGQADYYGCLEDYAFLIRALITLFETGQGVEWLEWTIQLVEILGREFKAPEGAFYQTDGTDDSIILRKCSFADGAEPSGNAIHCENLLRLFQITNYPGYLEQAEDILRAAKQFIDSYSPGYCYHMICLERYYDPHCPTLVIALNEKKEHFSEIINLIETSFIPHKAVIIRHHDDEKLINTLPYLQSQVPLDGKTTLYICYEGTCKMPIHDIEMMHQAISKL
ncbi:MAG: thioredoxin domain-containing protein [Chlamydiales bacterium]|nr:thioredoxin domain-containing protein [Chlamydiia bacterium]MCP5507671.1 thioredoxin domain-containing protein [Chlamydiales bacterium]